MTFIVDNRPTFTRTAKARVPDGEGVREETFKATFIGLPMEDLVKYDFQTAAGIVSFLKDNVVHLDDIADKDGQLPYSEAVRDLVLGWRWARSALLQAYLEGVSGAAEGN